MMQISKELRETLALLDKHELESKMVIDKVRDKASFSGDFEKTKGYIFLYELENAHGFHKQRKNFLPVFERFKSDIDKQLNMIQVYEQELDDVILELREYPEKLFRLPSYQFYFCDGEDVRKLEKGIVRYRELFQELRSALKNLETAFIVEDQMSDNDAPDHPLVDMYRAQTKTIQIRQKEENEKEPEIKTRFGVNRNRARKEAERVRASEQNAPNPDANKEGGIVVNESQEDDAE